MKKLNLAGQRFGRLTVIRECGHQGKKVSWLCNCDCGNTSVVTTTSLRSKNTKSCGCYDLDQIIKRNTKHGMARTREHHSWIAMKARCFNKKTKSYPNYGGRGITVCARWVDSFENFYADMGPCPKGSSIDRVDNQGNYEPSNCRWSTRQEQVENRRVNLNIVYQGTCYPTIASFAKALGLDYLNFKYLFRVRKLPIDEAVAKARKL